MTDTKITPSKNITTEQIAIYFTGDDSGLSYEVIGEKPIDYTFEGETFDLDHEDKGWRVADHPNIEAQLEELEPIELELEDVGTIEIEVPAEDGEITINLPRFSEEATKDLPLHLVGVLAAVNASLAVYGIALDLDTMADGQAFIQRDKKGWADIIKAFGLDPYIFEEDNQDDDEQWNPVMSYAYPLGRDGCLTRDDWHRVMSNCTIVLIDGAPFLALTGGGMDMTWEICESYLRCGYFPPAHFASLPAMAGRGTTEHDAMIIAACRVSLEAMVERYSFTLAGLTDLEDAAHHYAAKRASA